MSRTEPAPARPRLSVVIPSLAREDSLLLTLGELARQRYPDWECLVVLQGRPDPRACAAMRRTLQELRPLQQKAKQCGHSQALGPARRRRHRRRAVA